LYVDQATYTLHVDSKLHRMDLEYERFDKTN